MSGCKTHGVVEKLLGGMQHVPQLKPLPKFPAIRRDLSLVAPEATRYEKIESLIRSQNPANMEELQYVTTYRGKPLEKGQKSVTVTLVSGVGVICDGFAGFVR